MAGQLAWFVTGCSSGLGEALVRAILSKGDKVIVTAQASNGTGGAQRLAALEAAGAAVFELDITAPQAELNEKAKESWSIYGQIDVLVNNAGYIEAAIVEMDTRGQGGGRYMGFNALDLRNYVPAPWNGPDAAVSIYHTGILCSVELEDHGDFDSLAAFLGRNYKRDLGKYEPRNVFDFLAEYVRKVLGLLGAAPAVPLHASAHPELSSIGIVENYLPSRYEGSGEESGIDVEEWWIAVEVINRLLLTNVWTLKGLMTISVNWNEAFYTDEFVSRFLDEWKTVFLKEPGVD